MSHTERFHAEFSREDSDRLKVLANEIQERLSEIEKIATTARGAPLPDGAKMKFVPRTGPQDKTYADYQLWIEILDMPDGTTCCVVLAGENAGSGLYCPC